jgi:methylthioribose-1-phosphate isomerase
MVAAAPPLTPVRWRGGAVLMLDQTRLPGKEVWLELTGYRAVIEAVQSMRVRGAPAIGIAGAYAVALAALESPAEPGIFMSRLRTAADEIRCARPTGANLAWAVRRMMSVAAYHADRPEAAVDVLITEARRIHDEDQDANAAIGRLGAELLPAGGAVLTHCNTGALATGGGGTALGVITTAWDRGKLAHVYATETRPLLQGARLTAWELARAGVEATVLPDSAAGALMRGGRIGAIVVGADRIAANGDTANKIGTYTLAVLAREHGVPFYVAAPSSTVDMELPDGGAIPIEERPADEVTHLAGVRVVAEGVSVLNMAFDVTPNEYVTAIVTERGVAGGRPLSRELARLMEHPHA